MGAVQARIVFLAFVGLTLTVCYNAIFLQKGRHPAPITVETTQSLPTKKPSLSEPRVGGGNTGSDVVKAIQRELTAKGYDPGETDGIEGVLTRAAVMAYQHDNGLPVTGQSSSELLQNVVLGNGNSGTRSTIDGTIPPETVNLIRGVQQILAELGYGPGPVDGVFGASTQKAIEAFERERGMTVKGRISGKLLRELMRVTGTRLPTTASG